MFYSLMKKKKQIIFVGLSGGVDSAVSALLLKRAGYEVVGVFIKTWHPEYLPCNEEEERHDAMRVAAHLDIPFLTFDFIDVYKKEVADYIIREYKAGRTPNPDVMCNKEVKFGAFLKKAISMGADFIATGHYAELGRVENIFSRSDDAKQDILEKRYSLPSYARHIFLSLPGKPTSAFEKYVSLRKGKDPSKDQSYFLWTLKQEQLKKIIFPVGNFQKTEVRKLAKKFNLPVAEKKDSQGICFLGAVDLKEFLKHYIKEKKGKVVNTEVEIIGFHDGVVFSTLGERHGFTITKKGPNDGAYYVVAKDIEKNILTVSSSRNFSSESPRIHQPADRSGLGSSASVTFHNQSFSLQLINTNWINEISNGNKIYTTQVRYHGKFLSCKIKIVAKTKAEIIFEKPIMVASGQSCVVYDKDVCLGGGVVK